MIDRPPSIGELLPPQVLGAFAESHFIRRVAEEVEKEQILRFEDRVALQLAAPVAVGMLEGSQAASGRLDGRIETRRLGASIVRNRELVYGHDLTSPTSGPK